MDIFAYWEGYSEEKIDPYPLNEAPSQASHISIAFIQPIKDPKSSSSLATTWAFDSQFVFNKDDIKQWIKDINARSTNQKVLFSILDTPTCHWYPDCDIDKFAKSIASDCIEWGVAGIDIDAESGMEDPQNHYVDTFVSLIKSLRKYLNAEQIITYTCYEESDYDSQIIGQCKQDIAFINTMAYWLNFNEQISLFDHYADLICDSGKVGIGVKAGNGGDSTTLNTVSSIAQWIKQNDDINHKRMMLWSLTRDNKKITSKPDGSYLKCIYQNIVAEDWEWVIVEKADCCE